MSAVEPRLCSRRAVRGQGEVPGETGETAIDARIRWARTDSIASRPNPKPRQPVVPRADRASRENDADWDSHVDRLWHRITRRRGLVGHRK